MGKDKNEQMDQRIWGIEKDKNVQKDQRIWRMEKDKKDQKNKKDLGDGKGLKESK